RAGFRILLALDFENYSLGHLAFGLPYLAELQDAHERVQYGDGRKRPVHPVMPRYRRPKQDAADYKEQDRGVPVKARRCGVLRLVHNFWLVLGPWLQVRSCLPITQRAGFPNQSQILKYQLPNTATSPCHIAAVLAAAGKYPRAQIRNGARRRPERS